LIASKRGGNQLRWQTAAKDKAFDLIWHQVIIETRGETIVKVIRQSS